MSPLEFFEFILFITPGLLGGLLGGFIAGIATLIIIRNNSLLIERLKLLIGALGGFEGSLIFPIYYYKTNHPSEIFKLIIDYHQNLIKFKLFFLSIPIPAILGVIGANIAIFTMRKAIRWRW